MEILQCMSLRNLSKNIQESHHIQTRLEQTRTTHFLKK